jgi:hypothetical protein
MLCKVKAVGTWRYFNITLPPDYEVMFISYVNPETGELMFCQKTKLTIGYHLLARSQRYFIDDMVLLEGSTYFLN